MASLGLSWPLSSGLRKDHGNEAGAPSLDAAEDAVTVVVVGGLPAWLQSTAFQRDLTRRVQHDLHTFGLIRGNVAVFQRQAELQIQDHGESLHWFTEAPHEGVRLTLQMEFASQWPVLKSINVDCKIHGETSLIHLGSTTGTMGEWADDVWSARTHWEQRLLSGLAQHHEKRDAAAAADTAMAFMKSSVWNFISESQTLKTGQAVETSEESVWQQYGPAALAQLLSELILNSAMKMAANFLRSTMQNTLTTLPFWPADQLNLQEHFPPLQQQDMYVDLDKQLFPDLFLRLAAVVWTAAFQGISTLRQALDELRRRGMPLVRLALHTPILYKSGGRHRSLSGPLLMFVVDQLNQSDVATEMLHALIASSADPNANYVLFPTGKHKAIGRFPLLCLAGNRQAHGLAETLLRTRADANQEITLNYFPHGGNALWSAVWGSDYGMIRLLLTFGDADVNVRAWHPDAPPLTGQARHLQLLSLASTALDAEHVQLLLECKADFQAELTPTFAACHAEVTRLLASHVAYSHPATIVHRCDELNGTCGVWIHWVFQEVAADITSKRLFRTALSAAGADPELRRSFMRLLCDLIQRLPAAAAELLDNIALQSPQVQEPGRHPLRTRCRFRARECHTAYIAETRWAPSGTKFQNRLAPPATEAGERFLWLFPSMRQVEFCDIQLVDIPCLIDAKVLGALRALPWETLVMLLNESIVFQALVDHVWRDGMRRCHYVQASTSLIQFCCLLIWWQRTESIAKAICWAVFVAAVAFQVSSIMLTLHRRSVPSLQRVVHAGMGVHLAAFAWLAWQDTQQDENYRSSMAVNVVACIASVVYSCRVLQPFGIRVGQSLLPILNSVGRREFAAMAMLIFVTLFATALYVCIEFDTDVEGFAQAAFQTWQTLIVGEPALVNANDETGRNVTRFLAIALFFFACNTVLMNIFINVTGSVYVQETANTVGSFQAERLRICEEAVAGTHFARCAVFIEFLVAWCLWLLVRLLTTSAVNALNILIAMLCWIVGFCWQWHLARQAAASIDSFEGSSLSGQPVTALRYLWICRPTDHAGVHSATRRRSIRTRSPRAEDRSPLAHVRALQSRFERHRQYVSDDLTPSPPSRSMTFVEF